MTTDPQDPQDRPDDAEQEGTVSESEANPPPPDTDVTTAEDVHDMPQSPTRPDVAEDDRQPD